MGIQIYSRVWVRKSTHILYVDRWVIDLPDLNLTRCHSYIQHIDLTLTYTAYYGIRNKFLLWAIQSDNLNQLRSVRLIRWLQPIIHSVIGWSYQPTKNTVVACQVTNKKKRCKFKEHLISSSDIDCKCSFNFCSSEFFTWYALFDCREFFKAHSDEAQHLDRGANWASRLVCQASWRTRCWLEFPSLVDTRRLHIKKHMVLPRSTPRNETYQQDHILFNVRTPRKEPNS
jgi:hypothetical protein